MQFERLCSLLLETEAELGELSWHGHSDAQRWARVEDDVMLGDPKVRLRGPVMLAVVWVRDPRQGAQHLSEFAKRLEPVLDEGNVRPQDSVLVLTSLDRNDALEAIRRQAFSSIPTPMGTSAAALELPAMGGRVLAASRHLTVVGARELAEILDRDPGLRARMPSVLGLRNLEALIDPGVRGRSSLDVEHAQELARVFWPTRAYERARDVLIRHRFVVLTGPPEMGKTAIARMLALAQLTAGWEAHECNEPEQVWRVFDPGRRQVFVADDAFGSTEYRPDAAERWARGLGRLLRMLDSQHWLVWTSRPAPLKAGLRRVQRERGAERFPAPGEVLVDASDLDLSEKTLILFRHAKNRGVSRPARELVRSAALSIVEHPHFTPERIRRLVSDRLEQLPRLADRPHGLLSMIERELASPTDAMRTSFRALEHDHRELLIALLDAPAGLIDERELAATLRRHHTGGLSRPPAQLIDRLTDHFLRVTPLGIGWVHPSWRDLVIDELTHHPGSRRRFLATCGVDGATLGLSRAGGSAGERSLPLLATDSDWDLLGDRLHQLVRELEDQDVARVLLALADTLEVIKEARQEAEAQDLATDLLDATRRAWERPRPLPLFLLKAWYTLNAKAAEPIDPPALGATWAELHPGSRLLQAPDRSELARVDEWLALAQLLLDCDPAALDAFGFQDRDHDLLERLIVILTRIARDSEELRPLAQSVLSRVEDLVPNLAARAHDALRIGRRSEYLGRERWWMPEDIPAPPTTEPVTLGPTDFKRTDVERVLSDL
ncbi:MAG: hypothetical protein ACTHQQ_06440 [Solirubrobacteraceae bacterium]